MSATILPFPKERARPAGAKSYDYLSTRPLHELIEQAKRLGAFLHYCDARQLRVFVKNGGCCPVCGESDGVNA